MWNKTSALFLSIAALMLGLAFATTALIGIALDRTGIIDRVFESAVFSGASLTCLPGIVR